jgi:hypothetical protein
MFAPFVKRPEESLAGLKVGRLECWNVENREGRWKGEGRKRIFGGVYPTPGCFGQRVWNCLKRKELCF